MTTKLLRPTIREVALAAGVSTVTVSRVASGSHVVKPSTRARVEEAIRALGYQPNVAARAMRTNATKTIGFLIPDLRNELFAAVARSAEVILADKGYLLFLYSSDRSTARETEFLETAAQRGMDGLILSLCDETCSEVLEAIRNCRVPVAIWDRDVDVPADIVLNEHASAMRTVTEHLIALGHRSIGLISAPLVIRPGRERVRGFLSSVDANAARGVIGHVRNGRQSTEFGFAEFMKLMQLSPRPTAVIAGGNDIFHGVMKAVRSLRLMVPDDVSIVGTDDRLVSELMDPPITVIDRDMEAIGRVLAERLLHRLHSPSDVMHSPPILASRVILRSSTASPRSRQVEPN